MPKLYAIQSALAIFHEIITISQYQQTDKDVKLLHLFWIIVQTDTKLCNFARLNAA